MTGKLSDEIEFQFLQERAQSVIESALDDFPRGRFVVMVLGADDDHRCATASNMPQELFVTTLETTLKMMRREMKKARRR